MRRARPSTRVYAIVSVEYQLLDFERRDSVFKGSREVRRYKIDAGDVDLKLSMQATAVSSTRAATAAATSSHGLAIGAIHPTPPKNEKRVSVFGKM